MNRLIFDGIRCFHDHYSIPIKPLTLLVGENSTGKTTFLALTCIAWDIANSDLNEDIFNQEPFLLGAYDQIASYCGGKTGRVKSFTIGMENIFTLKQKQNNLFNNKSIITAKFIPARAVPKLEEWCFECGTFKIQITALPESDRPILILSTPRGTEKRKLPIMLTGLSNIGRLTDIILQSNLVHAENNNTKPLLTIEEFASALNITLQVTNSIGVRPYAFAPIRTKPQRTYDPIKGVPKPEGQHMPMVLADYLLEKTIGSANLKKALTDFGKTSGLFRNLEVKRKGHKESDPFQIAVTTTGPAFNLVDVGYGVSQVLPIIVDVLKNPDGSTFLLQQPEVHLHPRAQAELGSFLAVLANEKKKRFVIETHSDYLIDRIRMDIRDKKSISPDDVVILYFDKTTDEMKIHEITIDKNGNLNNVPPTYRRFFLEEERRMLGI